MRGFHQNNEYVYRADFFSGIGRMKTRNMVFTIMIFHDHVVVAYGIHMFLIQINKPDIICSTEFQI